MATQFARKEELRKLPQQFKSKVVLEFMLYEFVKCDGQAKEEGQWDGHT